MNVGMGTICEEAGVVVVAKEDRPMTQWTIPSRVEIL